MQKSGYLGIKLLIAVILREWIKHIEAGDFPFLPYIIVIKGDRTMGEMHTTNRSTRAM